MLLSEETYTKYQFLLLSEETYTNYQFLLLSEETYTNYQFLVLSEEAQSKSYDESLNCDDTNFSTFELRPTGTLPHHTGTIGKRSTMPRSTLNRSTLGSEWLILHELGQEIVRVFFIGLLKGAISIIKVLNLIIEFIRIGDSLEFR